MPQKSDVGDRETVRRYGRRKAGPMRTGRARKRTERPAGETAPVAADPAARQYGEDEAADPKPASESD